MGMIRATRTTGIPSARPAEQSFLYCERVTRQRARNFWYGIRLLPPEKRRALAAVYAMARRIDDVGDGGLDTDGKREGLARIESSLAAITPDARDPVLAAIGVAAQRFPLPLAAFGELIEGVRMDLDGAVYTTFDDTLRYCRRVAGTIGRLSLAVFGPSDPARAEGLADDLGVAMQLTNILRDVREDLEAGRVYLPAEDLERFGCIPASLAPPGDRAVAALIGFEVERARSWFARGRQLLPLLDRRSRACAGAMAGIYRRVLARIEADPLGPIRRRVSLAPWEKALVAGGALMGAER